MKIVAVLGSSRPKSNSSAIARTILEKAKASGADIQEFQLKKLKYSGCIGCETCKTKLDHCVLKDDLAEVLQAMRSADVVVLSSPNYFGEVSGQFKAFFDRTYSFLNPDFSSRVESGKTSIFIFAQGQQDLSLYADVQARYERWLKHYGFTTNYVIRMNGPRDNDSLSKRPDLVVQAEDIAGKIVFK